ncbi:MAG: flagellar biosynthesis anti-sigma factor FlgM [Nitrospirae bacterium]|nr:flagellar biosynthesis anti-sigma factor FlgM [Nitrospirota bacterium]
MKINNHDPMKDLNAYMQGVKEVQKDRAQEKSAVNETGGTDQAHISSKAKAAQQIKKEIDALPDIRVKKVDDAKKAIEAGTYNIKGEKVAAKIIGEGVIDSIL